MFLFGLSCPREEPRLESHVAIALARLDRLREAESRCRSSRNRRHATNNHRSRDDLRNDGAEASATHGKPDDENRRDDGDSAAAVSDPADLDTECVHRSRDDRAYYDGHAAHGDDRGDNHRSHDDRNNRHDNDDDDERLGGSVSGS